MKGKYKRWALLCLFFALPMHALTLKESVDEAIKTNPVVQERLKNYRATQQDLHIAESEYYPQLDFRASLGYNHAGHLKDLDNAVSGSYDGYSTALVLTQNLFDGFSTKHKVDYQEARTLAAAYSYVEKANDIAYKTTKAYLNVLQAHELLKNAKENVKSNESIYAKVQDLFKSGLTADSEVKKINSSLALARSNLVVRLNNVRDAEYSFRRLLGRMPEYREMEKPQLDIAMPDSIERAALYAINHNPSLLVSRYNIKGAQALYLQSQKEFYPKVDLEIDQYFNDQNKYLGWERPDDRFRAQIVLNYNLFRGGADKANIQKQISKINQEVEIKRDLKRQVIEGLDLSWDSYEMVARQLKDLQEYYQYSEKTLELFKDEYDLGRRSLLDLLAAQNDVFSAKSQIITAKYSLLLAKYRILDAMGLLPMAILGGTQEFTSNVNLYQDDTEAKEVLDTLPISLDADKDNIVDNEDLCDNSVELDKIMPYGCKKQFRDSDGDGVADTHDKCPLTPKEVNVSSDGCALDLDKDGVKDFEDKCPNTPFGYDVDKDGCASSIVVTINFAPKSAELPNDIKEKVQEFADFMNKNKQFSAIIIGHTSKTPTSDRDYNLKLSKARAESFKNALVKLGVDPSRLQTEGRGYDEPIADNSTPEGRYRNRRVEILLSK